MAHIGEEFRLGDIGRLGLFRRRLQGLRLASPLGEKIADAVLPLPVAQGRTDGGHEIVELDRPLDQGHVADSLQSFQTGQGVRPRRRQDDDRQVRPVLLFGQGRLQQIIAVGQDMFLGQDQGCGPRLHLGANLAQGPVDMDIDTVMRQQAGGHFTVLLRRRQNQDTLFQGVLHINDRVGRDGSDPARRNPACRYSCVRSADPRRRQRACPTRRPGTDVTAHRCGCLFPSW